MEAISESMLFVEVVHAGSISAAADRLGISKAQLSRQMSALEKNLSASLFLRSPRGIKLTDQGILYYQSCLNIKNQFNHAKETLSNHQGLIMGNIAVTAPMSIGSMYIGPLLTKFMKIYPNVTIELDLSDYAVNLDQSNYDLALRAAKKLPDSNLKARQLFKYDYVIAGSKDYFDGYGIPATPDELEQHRVITCITTHQNLKHSWPFSINGEIVNIAIKSIAKVTHMWVQKHMALSSIGLIRVPRYWVKNELIKGDLIEILEPYMFDYSYLFAVYKNMTHVPQRLRAFIDFIYQYLPLEMKLNDHASPCRSPFIRQGGS